MNRLAREKIASLMKSLSARLGNDEVMVRETPRSEPEIVKAPKLDASARSLTITFSTIALAAKLSATDKPVDDKEIHAFCNLFSMPEDELPKIRALFARAVSDKSPAEHYARQIARLLGDSMKLRHDLLRKLCKLAEADGKVTLSEQRMLTSVSEVLGFDEEEMQSLLTTAFVLKKNMSAHELLRLPRKATLDEVKQAYRSRLRDLHPDVLASRVMAQEDVEHAREELLAVQRAYNEIISRRKF